MKPCPFCAEEIQDAAVKCRFCGSAITPGAVSAAEPVDDPGRASHPPAAISVLFEGSPSWKAWFWSYVLAEVPCLAAGLGLIWFWSNELAGVVCLLAVLGVLWMSMLQMRRRSTSYRITDSGIDYETGTLSKKIETVQLWRIKHVDFEQTFFQRILGISEIHITTTDGEDQQLILRGLIDGREIFNRLRDALQLARQRQVVGITQ